MINAPNKPSILLVHNYYQIPGGEDSVVENEKQLLEQHGHKVILYTRNNTDIKQFSLTQKLFLPFSSIFSLKTYRDIQQLLRKEQIDLVHVHNTLALISPSVYYAANSCNIPVIQTVHNFRFLCPASMLYRDGNICEECLESGLHCSLRHKCYRNSFIQTFVCFITLKLHRTTNIYKKINFLFLTTFNQHKYLEFNQRHPVFDPSRMFIKPNFSAAAHITIEKKKNQFIYVSRLDRSKGIHLLLDAWKQISFANLIICGTGPEEEYCRLYIKQHHLSNVTLKGFVPHANILQLICESKALILPSQQYEGFPMAMLESWSVGTPVIGSKLGNVGSLIEDGINGYRFTHNSIDDLVRVIKQLDQANLSVLPDPKYSAETNYQCLTAIYQQILAKQNPHHDSK